MLISDKYRYIFIAIPKTGTTAIQSFLLKNDDSCVWNSIQIDGKRINIDEHIKTKNLKRIMGEKFNEYKKISFIRNPYSRIVSSYFFYKNVNMIRSKNFIRNLMARINVLSTEILPFSIWSVLKPTKKLVDYFYDDDKQLLIDLVGKTENLNEDLLSICSEIGIALNSDKVAKKNKSKHSSVEGYYSNSFHKKIITKKIRKDIELYNAYKDRLCTENY
jgi:hypothetical protein